MKNHEFNENWKLNSPNIQKNNHYEMASSDYTKVIKYKVNF